MFELLGIPPQALFGQVFLGLINGSFYAMLSLGLAVIFGMLNVINFAHGALYMMGAFAAYFLLEYAGIGYWPALILAPLIVAAFGMVIEKTMLCRLYSLDHLYGLLLTFGLALIIEGMFQHSYGVSGLPYVTPAALMGGYNLGFMFLPAYRGWVSAALPAPSKPWSRCARSRWSWLKLRPGSVGCICPAKTRKRRGRKALQLFPWLSTHCSRGRGTTDVPRPP